LQEKFGTVFLAHPVDGMWRIDTSEYWASWSDYVALLLSSLPPLSTLETSVWFWW